MSGTGAHLREPPQHSSLAHRFSPRRVWRFFRKTSLLDRVAFAVILIYVGVLLARHFVARLNGSSFLGFLAFLAVVYLLIRSIPWIRDRLLWSLRNRLTAVYIFIAVIPILLLLSMVGAAVYLLELQIGAHLLHDDLQARISIISADTNAITAAVSREPGIEPDRPVPPNSRNIVPSPVLSRPGVESVIAAAQARWPSLSVYLNHGSQLVRAANGKQFAGLVEFRGRLYFSSAESLTVPGGRATVLVIAPITPTMLDHLPPQLGPVKLTLLDPAENQSGRGISLNGTVYATEQEISSNARPFPPKEYWIDPAFNGYSTLEARRADLGEDAVQRPVLAQFGLRFSSVNGALLNSVGDIGPILVDFLEGLFVAFLLLEVAAFTTGYFLSRTITGSISDLYEGTMHVRRGDLAYRIRISRRDQLGSLGESFNEMIGSVGELIDEQRERQKLAHEVEIASEVQQQLFPHSLPSIPGLDLAAICRPARVVSGDYYDFITLSPTRVVITVADISGKGIFAALLMASLQAALRSTTLFESAAGSAEIVSRLNLHLFKNTSDDRYATLFCAIYDSEAKTLTYTNAGHLPPFFINDGCVQCLDQGGTVVGLFEDVDYAECTLPVKPGTLLVAFSDGLTEPENVYGEEFGAARLKAEVLAHRAQPAAKIAESLLTAVEQWSGTAEQADDMTVVIARMS